MTDLALSPPMAQPGLTPVGKRRRLPSPRAVRRRYRIVQWTLTAIGGAIGALYAMALLAAITARGLSPDLVAYGVAGMLLLIGFGAPLVVVEILWRLKRRRNEWHLL
jgi:hypothetical protein